MEHPLVSFIVPAFNARRTIDQTLQSILSQALANWEAIIVDDGSTDGTAKHCSRWLNSDARFRLLRQRNAGASAARNTAIQAARGRWLVFLDADDWISENFLSVLLPLVEEGDNDCLAYCAYVRVSPTGDHLPPDFCPELMTDPFDFLAERCEPAIHCVLVSRQSVLDVGGFDVQLATCEDWDLWLRLARRGVKFIGCDAPLAFYRMRDGSLSSDNERVDRDALLVLQRATCVDPRVLNADERYHHGKAADTANVIDWRSYLCSLERGEHVIPPCLSESDWVDTVGDIAFAILGLVADDNRCKIPALAGLGRAVAERYQHYTTLLQESVPVPGLGLLVLSKANRLALMEADLSLPKSSGDWLGIELDLGEWPNLQWRETGAAWVLLRVRRGKRVLGYIDLDAGNSAADVARAVLDGLSLSQLMPTLLVSQPPFWRALCHETYLLGSDYVSHRVRHRSCMRTAKGMARQALRSAVLNGLEPFLPQPRRTTSLNRPLAGRINDDERSLPPRAAEDVQFQVPVVVYRIDDAHQDDDGVSVAAIEAQLTYLHRNGYRSLPLAELHARIARRTPVPAKQVVLIVEEVTYEQLERLRPILSITKFTCVACPRPGEQLENLLSQGEREKPNTTFELGLSVSPLHTFAPQRQLLEEALRPVRARADSLLACVTAVPPHDLLLRQLTKLGFDLVVGTGSGVTDLENCSLTLPRIQATHSDSLGMFAEKLRCSSWTV